MKKIKIMLAGLAIVSVVGSSLAFKAAKFGTTIFTGSSATSCPTQTNNSTFAVNTSSTVFATTAGGQTNNCVAADISTLTLN